MTDVDAGALWRGLGEDADKGLNVYLATCAKRDADIRRAGIEAATGRADLLTDLSAGSLDRVRVSLLMSDLTALYFDPNPIHDRTICFGRNEPHWPTEFTIPVELIRARRLKIRDGHVILQAAHLIRSDGIARAFLDDVAPLIRSGSLLIRPIPCMFSMIEEPINPFDGELLPVNPNRHEWSFDGEFFDLETAHISDAAMESAATGAICSFVMPMISNIPFKRYAEILADEGDCVATQRAAFRQLVRHTQQSPADANLLIKDVVQPACDKIARRFRAVNQMHSMRALGSTLAAVTVGLTASSSGFPEAMIGAFGTGGLLTWSLSEIAALRKARSDLRDEPHYLLWRLGRESTRRPR